MSQAGIINTTTGPVPPTVPTSFVTDSGTAIPAANILNVVTPGGGTQGISTSGSGSTITITLTDIIVRATCQTINAGTATFNVNIPIPTSNSSASIRANMAGYAKTAGTAIGGELIGAVRNVGGVLTVIGTPDLTRNNDVSLSAWNCTLTVSGTNALVQVTGVAGVTINWTAIIDFIIATEGQA